MGLPVERRHLAVGLRTLSYLAAGRFPSDRTVVFLHAFPLNAEMWMPQLRTLPEGWAAVAPDFRGFGGSTPDEGGVPRGRASLDDYAEDVEALVDALGAQRAAMCGCSMGGYAAFAALRRMPGRVSGLLLADTRATADAEAARASRAAMIEVLDRDGPSAVAAEMRPRLVGATSRDTRADVLAAIDRMMAQATAPGVGCAIARMLNRPDSSAELAVFTGPVTVVVGEEDVLTPPAEAAATAALVPGASLVTIPHAGHLASLEAPEAFNLALCAWLDAIATERP